MSFFKSLFLLSLIFTTASLRVVAAEQETLVQGLGRDKSENDARAEALDQCRKNLALAKNVCIEKKGRFREVICGVRCTDLTTFWDCRASGSGFCHGQQEAL